MGASIVAMSRAGLLAFAGLSLAACASVEARYPAPGSAGGYGAGRLPAHTLHGTDKPYQINGRWYYPSEQPDYNEIGLASWYGDQFHNRYTADGEMFDMNMPSAAHKTLPLPSLVEVTNLANGRKMTVRVNDRGPFVDGRIIDMSKEAAKQLGFYGQGVAQVRVRYIGPAPDLATEARVYQASARAPVATQKPAPVREQIAAMRPIPNPILGSEIEDRPIQATPSTVDWNSTPNLASYAPARPAPITAAPLPAPTPSTTVVDTAVVAPTGSSPDIDSLLASLSDGAPAAQSPAVQTGAFFSRLDAERAAAALPGPSQIVPVQQDGRMLYKVVLAR
jgi:rare lipoprotein A